MPEETDAVLDISADWNATPEDVRPSDIAFLFDYIQDFFNDHKTLTDLQFSATIYVDE